MIANKGAEPWFPSPHKTANRAAMSEMKTVHATFASKVDAVLAALEAEGTLPPECPRGNVTVEPPRDPSHGDLATNAAMVLAKHAKTNPRELAAKIVEKLAADPVGPDQRGASFPESSAPTRIPNRQDFSPAPETGRAFAKRIRGQGGRRTFQVVDRDPGSSTGTVGLKNIGVDHRRTPGTAEMEQMRR